MTDKETREIVQELLDVEYIEPSILSEASIDPKPSGATYRRRIIKTLMDSAASGNVAAAKEVLKLVGGKF